jgi:hypothetical protein
MEARAWVARTEYDFARMLLRGEDHVNWKRGRSLLTASLETAKQLGMRRLEEQAAALLGPEEADRPSAENRFRREGDFWEIVFAGKALLLRHGKGLAYISELLRRPKEDVHVADLAAAAVNGEGEGWLLAANVGESATRRAGPGNTGNLIDSKAKGEYKRRLEDLRADLEESRERRDRGRVEKLQAEIQFIEEELIAAYGLGGRPRRGADIGERLRKAVTNRIRVSLGRIRKEDRKFGAHLDSAITMGTFCSYSPSQPIEWEL